MIQNFLADVTWGDLDFLIIDTPPGMCPFVLSQLHDRYGIVFKEDRKLFTVCRTDEVVLLFATQRKLGSCISPGSLHVSLSNTQTHAGVLFSSILPLFIFVSRTLCLIIISLSIFISISISLYLSVSLSLPPSLCNSISL